MDQTIATGDASAEKSSVKFAIRSRWSDRIIFEADIECSADASNGIKLGLAVRLAYKSDAVLRDAVLRGADLRGADLSGADLSGADLSGAVLRDADLSGAVLRDAVLRGADLSGADLSGAVLRGADLSGADLRSFKADLWMTLTQNRNEAAGVAAALREGRVNGSTYEGDCACLVGTIANVKQVSVSSFDRDSSRPAERWFLMINQGDKAGDDTPGGFAATKALEWVLEWGMLNGIDCGEMVEIRKNDDRTDEPKSSDSA